MISPELVALLCVALAYVLGSIPTGFWLVKVLKGIDLRQVGSGGTGATNVKRNAGWPAAVATLVLDALKGALAVYIALTFVASVPVSAWKLSLVPSVLPMLLGLVAIIAHSRSMFIGFAGGKSVATSLGVFLVLEPRVMLPALGVAVLTIIVSRYVSLGSILGAISCAVLAFALPNIPAIHQTLFCLVALYLIWLHRSNLQRLCQGCENKL